MATLGYTTIGGSTQNLVNDFLLACGPFTASENGTITQVSVYTVTASRLLTVGVYNNSAGYPGSLVADSDEATSSANSWLTVNVSGAIVSGSAYWIGWNADTSAVDYKYDADASFSLKYVPSTYVAGTLDDPYPVGASTLSSVKFSAYITYTPEAVAVKQLINQFNQSVRRASYF